MEVPLGRTHFFVGPVRREHGLLAVVEARVVRVVAVQPPLHELLPVSTKHAACRLRGHKQNQSDGQKMDPGLGLI